VTYPDQPTPHLAGYAEEPPHGSVLLLHGHTGTAYQRHFSDGLWHAAGQRAGLSWSTLHKQSGFSGVLVVYVAPEEG
jgi:hypothetical protein